MAARHWYGTGGGMVELTSRVQRESWTTAEDAEEGANAQWSVQLADPAMDLTIVGHQRYLVTEDASTGPDTVLWGGFTAEQKVSRGQSETLEPIARVWTVALTDANIAWGRRVMVGSDCNRKAENDTARMAWLLGTDEAALFGDVSTYVSASGPVAMDAVDYRGQMFSQVADDCAQASGKNWFAWWRWDAGLSDYVLTAWYGKDSL